MFHVIAVVIFYLAALAATLFAFLFASLLINDVVFLRVWRGGWQLLFVDLTLFLVGFTSSVFFWYCAFFHDGGF